MKKSICALTAVLIVGCETFGPAFTRGEPEYDELPVATLKENALEIERAIQDGKVPELTNSPNLILETPAIQQAVSTRVSRIELVNELLDKGFAWERRNGHLYIIRNRAYKEATTRRERDRNALIVTGEWDDRWMLYEQLRKVNDFPPKSLTAIQHIFHEARVEVMETGQLYENIDGEPVPKQ
ncbi:MAG: hypothetical protein R6V12_15355 [Candidatus Hydrogenedentota bacterium]